jgi:hypothetical protein
MRMQLWCKVIYYMYDGRLIISLSAWGKMTGDVTLSGVLSFPLWVQEEQSATHKAEVCRVTFLATSWHKDGDVV